MLLLIDAGICFLRLEKFVGTGVLLLDCTDCVDISDVDVVGVGTSDSVLADGNALKIDLYNPSIGTLPASTTPVSFTKSGAERGYSPLLS